jgi:hypothetical protein
MADVEKVRAAFVPVERSIRWARDAMLEFEDIARASINNDAFVTVVEQDPATGESVQKIRMTRPLSDDLDRKALEALNNSRHSFDQATHAANAVLGGPTKGIYFPWADSPTHLSRRLADIGIDCRLWDVFTAHQPYPQSPDYPGGNTHIRHLSTRANKKHTIGLTLSGQVKMLRLPDVVAGDVRDLQVRAAIWDSERNETETMRWHGQLQITGQPQMLLFIAFKDTNGATGINAHTALTNFINKAQAIMDDLRARCLAI